MLGGKGRWEAGVHWYADAVNRVPTVLINELINTAYKHQVGRYGKVVDGSER